MRVRKQRPLNRLSNRGASLIQVVIALAVLFGFVALTVDYGSMVVRQRRLQAATDAAALGAGPDMAFVADGTPQATATNIAGLNTVVTSDPNRFSATGVSDATGITLTVTAADYVSTPFLNVLASGSTQKTVSARSILKATPGINPAWIAPLAIKKSFLDNAEENKLWGLPCDLIMATAADDDYDKKLNSWIIHYSDDPGTPASQQDPNKLQANVIGIDVHARATIDYNAALNDYRSIFLNGATVNSSTGKYLDFLHQGQDDYIASFPFRGTYDGGATAAWKQITSDCVTQIRAASSISDSAAMQINIHNIPHDDSRFVAMMLIDRSTGSGNKIYDSKFLGYVGFFVQGLTYNSSGIVTAIHGFLCPASGEWTGGGGLPSGPYYGLYTYKLTG